MKRSARWAAVVGAWMAAIAMTGCTGEVTSEPDAQRDPGAAQAGAERENSERPTGSAGLRDSITLEGFETSIQVTPLAVQDPVRSSNQFLQPDPGNRYVAVRVRLRNVGDAVYADSPSNGASVVDADDVGWDASLFDAAEPALGTLRIGPGDARVGFITFEVAEDSVLRTLQITTDSGFGNTGEWSLR